MSAWTPGPWHVERAVGRYEIWPKDKGQTHTYIGVVQTKADAQLIALAPEMAEALMDVVGFLADMAEDYADYGIGDKAKRVRALLARLEGGEAK